MDNPKNNQVKDVPFFNPNFVIPKKQFTEEGMSEQPEVYQQSSILANQDDYQTLHYNTYNSNMNAYNAQYLNLFQQVQSHPAFFHKEVPKTYTCYKDTYSDRNDKSLPKELTDQLQPLYCKLCDAQLSSNITAKLHYQSKNHKKKMRKYLIDYSDRTGEPLHEKAKLERRGFEINDTKYFHCDICNIHFTGRLHAESHYMGRNHRRAAIKQKTSTLKGSSSPIAATAVSEFSPLSAIETTPSNFHCELCNVHVTSSQQMKLHTEGQKHKKKVRLLNGQNFDSSEGNTPVPFTKINPATIDLSIYRTPMGFYYCKNCNLTLSSDVQFQQHLTSKKHLKKVVAQ